MSKTGKTKIVLDKGKPELLRQMLTRGLPKQILSFPSYSLEDKTAPFRSVVPGLKDKNVSKEKQLDNINKILENPFYGPYVCCISGKPHDMQAKLLAAYLMLQATKLQTEGTSSQIRRRVKDRGFPVWHNVYSGFDNAFIQKESGSYHKPSLLILSNVTPDSTPHKIEKVRDILEANSTIPRIVVVSGSDPLTFFHTKLYLNLNACCYLTNSIVKKAHEF